MVDTMREAQGIGLAANQVGVLKRLIVVQLPEEEEASIYINPEIVHREGEREVEEGCLSIPGYRGFITRSIWVRFRALDHTSKLVKLKAEETLSQALEHEVDHLNGILYSDHLEEHQQLVPVPSEPEEQDDPTHEGEDAAVASSSAGSSPEADAGELGVSSGHTEAPASLRVK